MCPFTIELRSGDISTTATQLIIEKTCFLMVRFVQDLEITNHGRLFIMTLQSCEPLHLRFRLIPVNRAGTTVDSMSVCHEFCYDRIRLILNLGMPCSKLRCSILNLESILTSSQSLLIRHFTGHIPKFGLRPSTNTSGWLP